MLLRKVFPPRQAVVPGVSLEGLQLMVGKPKLGKTRLMLGIGVAVATGGKALGTLAVAPDPVLYLSLEDPERRLQQRFRSLLAGDSSPDTLEYATAWSRRPRQPTAWEVLASVMCVPLDRTSCRTRGHPPCKPRHNFRYTGG
jgi:hypothetical protein